VTHGTRRRDEVRSVNSACVSMRASGRSHEEIVGGLEEQHKREGVVLLKGTNREGVKMMTGARTGSVYPDTL